MRIKFFIANKIHDIKRGGPTLSVTMTLIFPKIVWTCPLSDVATASVHSEKTRLKKWIMIIIIIKSNRKNHLLVNEKRRCRDG